MEALVSIALWAAFVFLMMRVGCGSHMRHGGDGRAGDAGAAERRSGQELRWRPPEKATDPVCGTVVRTSRAKTSYHEGRVYYFCSRDCREIFEAAPELYLNGQGAAPAGEEHSHA